MKININIFLLSLIFTYCPLYSLMFMMSEQAVASRPLRGGVD